MKAYEAREAASEYCRVYLKPTVQKIIDKMHKKIEHSSSHGLRSASKTVWYSHPELYKIARQRLEEEGYVVYTYYNGLTTTIEVHW